MFRSVALRWANALPLSGPLAVMVAIAAIAVPTAVRAAVTGVVTGCEFTPYLPFVLASAILLRWSQAVVVAGGSVAILGGLFFGPRSTALSMPCFASSAAMFLGASAMMIGVAELFRRWISALQNREPDGGGIIFSLEDGEVWASWNGSGAPVRLGSKKNVSEKMKSFLAHADDPSQLRRRFW